MSNSESGGTAPSGPEHSGEDQDAEGGTLEPAPVEELEESISPGGPGLYAVSARDPHNHDKVRARIAYSILAGLGILYGALFVGLLWFDLPLDRFTAAAAALSAPQSLAAAAVGFYYAKK
jgi:hypothetical protein